MGRTGITFWLCWNAVFFTWSVYWAISGYVTGNIGPAIFQTCMAGVFVMFFLYWVKQLRRL